MLTGRSCLQGSREGTDDDDDYFHNEAGLPCIPDVPESLRSESDSMDLDELPCIVPEDLVLPNGPTRASSGSDEHQLPAPQPQSSTARPLAPEAASIRRSEHTPSHTMPLCDLQTCMWRIQGQTRTKHEQVNNTFTGVCRTEAG